MSVKLVCDIILEMITKQKFKDITWIDLEDPTQDEVRSLVDDYGIDPLMADELLSPTLRPKVDTYPDWIYLILHFPISYKSSSIGEHIDQEVDFVIGKDILITVRYRSIDAFNEFAKIFETQSILDRGDIDKHPGYLFFYMLRYLYRNLSDQVDDIKKMLIDAEDHIFRGKEKKMVFQLSVINRVILAFREATLSHREVLLSFEEAARKFFPEDFSHYVRSITGEYYKVQNMLNSNKEYLNELKDTNNSILSTKQNETMKTLTILAFITFPLTLFAGIFGMNTVDMPIVGENNDFWIIIAAMSILTIFMFILFKLKKWL